MVQGEPRRSESGSDPGDCLEKAFTSPVVADGVSFLGNKNVLKLIVVMVTKL